MNGTFEFTNLIFEFTAGTSSVEVTGNFEVFVGTLVMNVLFDEGFGPLANQFVVAGSVQLGPEDGVGGPTLNIIELSSIPSPIGFTLITSSAGSGAFNEVTASGGVLSHGWLHVPPSFDSYLVFL